MAVNRAPIDLSDGLNRREVNLLKSQVSEFRQDLRETRSERADAIGDRAKELDRNRDLRGQYGGLANNFRQAQSQESLAVSRYNFAVSRYNSLANSSFTNPITLQSAANDVRWAANGVNTARQQLRTLQNDAARLPVEIAKSDAEFKRNDNRVVNADNKIERIEDRVASLLTTLRTTPRT